MRFALDMGSGAIWRRVDQRTGSSEPGGSFRRHRTAACIHHVVRSGAEEAENGVDCGVDRAIGDARLLLSFFPDRLTGAIARRHLRLSLRGTLSPHLRLYKGEGLRSGAKRLRNNGKQAAKSTCGDMAGAKARVDF